jgi:osmotically-inducible protein OsmY
MVSDLASVSNDVDLDIQSEVNDALMALDFIGASRAEVSAHVTHGHVTLDGYVQSPMAVVEAGRAAEAVPGITGVTNRLVDDATLSRRVAEILSTDPATLDIPPGYEVSATFGFVRVVGRFDEDQARRILAVTETIPGVRRVTLKTY